MVISVALNLLIVLTGKVMFYMIPTRLGLWRINVLAVCRSHRGT